MGPIPATFRRRSIVTLLGLLATGPVHAGSIDFNMTAGGSLSIETLSVDSRPNSTRESGLVGDGSFSLTSASSDYPGFGHVVDRTYALGGSIGWKFNRSWEAGLMVNFSSTPAESLQQGGGSLYGDFVHYFGDGSGFEFQPSIGARLSLGSTRMTDRPNAVLRQLFPSLADVVDELKQKYATLEISGQPWHWFGARLSVTSFSYDKNVNQFINFLSDARSLGASTFAASLNGLPKSSSALGLYFYPSMDWDISLIGNSSRSISTGAINTGTQLTVSHEFNTWLRIGLGIERDVSDDVKQSLMVLNFSFAI